MKNLKAILVVLILFAFTGIANAQKQDVRKEKPKPAFTDQVKKGSFTSQSESKDQSLEARKANKKKTVWDIIPADGFTPTGNAELDKKRKMDIQVRWAKENPEKFRDLLVLHGIKPEKKK